MHDVREVSNGITFLQRLVEIGQLVCKLKERSQDMHREDGDLIFPLPFIRKVD
jgi:hypothetical protein